MSLFSKSTWRGARAKGFLRAGLVTALAGVILTSLWPVGDLSYDVSYRLRPFQKSDDVMLVTVTEASRKKLGDGANNVRRSAYTELLGKLAEDGAKLVFFDLLFSAPNADPRVDEELGKAMQRFGNVIVATRAKEIEHERAAVTEDVEIIEPVAAAAKIGHTNLSDGEPNREIPGEIDGTLYAPWIAATMVRTNVALENPNAVRWFNYYCAPKRTPFERVELQDATNTAAGFFRGKVVFVGQEGAGKYFDRKDAFPTPYSAITGQDTDGVVIHATAFANLVRGDWLRLTPVYVGWLLAIAWAGVLVGVLYPLSRRSLVVFVPIGVLLASGLAFASVSLQWRTNVWWPWAGAAFGQSLVAMLWLRARPLPKSRNAAFISYRRNPDFAVARMVANDLGQRGFAVFLDTKEMEAGRFDEQLLREIQDAEFFVIILSPEAVKRCVEPDDWVMRELRHAQAIGKRTIPIFVNGFTFKDPVVAGLPEFQKLSACHGLELTPADPEGFANKLAELLKSGAT